MWSVQTVYFLRKILIVNQVKSAKFSKNINIKRLKLIVRRIIPNFPGVNQVLKFNSLFISQVNFSRCIHCSSVINDFYKFVHKPRVAEKTEYSLSHTHLKLLLKDCKSFPEQLSTFYSYVNLTTEDIRSRSAICHEIKELLQPHFPSCSLHLIGSTVTGLGLKGCDMDLSFQANDNESSQIPSEVTGKLFLTKDVEQGKVPVSFFPSLNPKHKLLFLKRILAESGVVGTIIPGRIPILSFKYKGLSVDLSVNNLSGLQGTKFMSLCTSLDPRVAPLHHFVTYWAKNRNLCGGPLKFKSYGLFLLVVFFLQTRQPSVLPPVELILDRTEFYKNLDNWSYDISKYIHKIEKSENVQSLEELLREFFFFYANFDFTYVICTTKCELVKSWDFISERKNDFQINSISVQDPLNLSWNVTSDINKKHSILFTRELLSFCKVYQDSDRCQSSSDIGLSFFKNHPSFENVRNRKLVNLLLPLGNENQEEIAEKVKEVLRYCLDFQCKSVNESEVKLLRQNKPKTEEDSKYSEENGDESSQGTLVSRFLCTACRTQKTWLGRSNFELQSAATGNFVLRLEATHKSNSKLQDVTIDPSNLKSQSEEKLTSKSKLKTSNFELETNQSPVEVAEKSNFQFGTFWHSEREISKKLSASREGSEKDDFSFICECRCNGDSLNVTLEPVSAEEFIPKLAIFLIDYIPKCINKQLSNK